LYPASGKANGERLQGMKAYRILVHESRSAAPSELAAEMASDARVTEFCRERLAASPHLVSIEVWSGDKRLCQLWGEARQAA
jgi:hypothetical protein